MSIKEQYNKKVIIAHQNTTIEELPKINPDDIIMMSNSIDDTQKIIYQSMMMDIDSIQLVNIPEHHIKLPQIYEFLNRGIPVTMSKI